MDTVAATIAHQQCCHQHMNAACYDLGPSHKQAVKRAKQLEQDEIGWLRSEDLLSIDP